jgi:hypothetical protein
VYLGFFAWFSLNLLVSIIRTIWTNPGNIPEDKEWDMDVALEKEKKDKTAIDTEKQAEQKLTSEKFEKGKKDPQNLLQSSFKYLNTEEGDLRVS